MKSSQPPGATVFPAPDRTILPGLLASIRRAEENPFIGSSWRVREVTAEKDASWTVDLCATMTLNTQPRQDFTTFMQRLKDLLLSQPSSPSLFNQYRDCDPAVDLPDAAAIRMENLVSYLAEASRTAQVLIVGEAAGPWGCRFSGVPFAGERQLLDPLFPYAGRRSSKTGPPNVSRTALTFWEVMPPYHKQILVWDAFPLHPHQSGNPLSVRNPTKTEVAHYSTALRALKNYVNPRRIVAVGRMAHKELASIGEASTYVRHPSRGGSIRFVAEMRRIFSNPTV